jgi:hypothetical protein
MIKYRNKKLLRLAKEVDFCMGCGKINENDVVAAHLNFDKSKGMATKCHDYLIAYLCWKCHVLVDEGYGISSAERKQFTFKVFLKTLNWLFNNSYLEVNQKKKYKF